MHIGRSTLQAEYCNTLVMERWSLKDRLVKREERQDLTVMGKKGPAGEAGG